jgi:hypothetical protein
LRSTSDLGVPLLHTREGGAAMDAFVKLAAEVEHHLDQRTRSRVS